MADIFAHSLEHSASCNRALDLLPLLGICRGVQWHPEYLIHLPAQFALFRWLLRRVA